jgi:hypothetical protein
MNPNVIKGTTRQMTATGTYSDATTKDLTLEVTWTTANTAIATVTNVGSQKGTVLAVAVGLTTVTAAYPQTVISGTTGITVIP